MESVVLRSGGLLCYEDYENILFLSMQISRLPNIYQNQHENKIQSFSTEKKRKTLSKYFTLVPIEVGLYHKSSYLSFYKCLKM